MKTVEQRLIEWLLSSDTGSSSKAIAAHMSGNSHVGASNYPSDPSDLGRCLRLLQKIPEWSGRISEMAQYSPGWAGLIANWGKICETMDLEVGIDWSKGTRASMTWDLMQAAKADGYRKDSRYECTFDKKGCLSSYRKVR